MALDEKSTALSPSPSAPNAKDEGSISSSQASPSKKHHHLKGFGIGKKGGKDTTKIDVDPSTTPKDAAPELKPVSIFALFRFSTKLEIFLDLVGIVCAVCAGAAQVRMVYVVCWLKGF